MKATGSSSTKKTYTFTDRDIVNSGRKIIYYRLISNDNNGKPATSKVVSLHVKRAAEWSIKLNENPVRNNINITVNGITTPVQFTITDLAGKRVCSIQYNTADGLITLPADKLATGIYILTAETTTKRKAIKLLKQ